MKPKTKITIAVTLAFLLFTSFTVLSFLHEIKKERLPVLGQINPFQLTDTDGNIFDSTQRLNNRVWVANFFFTTCGDICPMLNKNMASLHRSFQLVDDIALVSFSVNPEHDTPSVLKSYAEKYEAKKNWYFLTGKREDLTKIIVDDFKLGHIKEPIFHSANFALVDRHGFIRGYYDGTKPEEINKLFKHTAQLKKE